jgi:uncharacterized protein YjeT (DUF2065 family)
LASHLLAAVGLVFILEGVVPFMAPSLWRSAVNRIAVVGDGQLRIFGLVAMLSGLTVLFMAR